MCSKNLRFLFRTHVKMVLVLRFSFLRGILTFFVITSNKINICNEKGCVDEITLLTLVWGRRFGNRNFGFSRLNKWKNNVSGTFEWLFHSYQTLMNGFTPTFSPHISKMEMRDYGKLVEGTQIYIFLN